MFDIETTIDYSCNTAFATFGQAIPRLCRIVVLTQFEATFRDHILTLDFSFPDLISRACDGNNTIFARFPPFWFKIELF